MDKGQLDKYVSELNEVIAKQSKNLSAYDAPKKLKKDAKDYDHQKNEHREKLLKLVSWLSVLSFLFLVGIITAQMWIRTSDPNYNGVSDTVINIITGGVFGEVIAVVAVIAKEVWKD